METVTLELKELTLALPDGFARMADSELEEAFGYSYDAWSGARDEARHVMVALIANDAGRIAGALASVADAAKGIERRMRTAHGADGYALERQLKGTVAGTKARGFSYRYQALGIEHIGEVWCVKRGHTFYSLYLYGRAEESDAARAVFSEVLAGANLA